RPSTFWDRGIKWARRRPAWTALLGVSVAAAVSLFAVAIWHALRMEQANEILLAEKAKFEQAAEEARQNAKKAECATLLAEFCAGYEVLGLKPYGFRSWAQRAADLPARHTLDRAAERVRAELRNQPGFQAALLDILGNVFRSLGEHDKAKQLLDEGLAIRRG